MSCSNSYQCTDKNIEQNLSDKLSCCFWVFETYLFLFYSVWHYSLVINCRNFVWVKLFRFYLTRMILSIIVLSILSMLFLYWRLACFTLTNLLLFFSEQKWNRYKMYLALKCKFMQGCNVIIAITALFLCNR